MATPQELADALLSRMNVYQDKQTLDPMGIPTNIETFGVNGRIGDKLNYSVDNSYTDDPNVRKTGIDNLRVGYTDDSGKTYDLSGGYNTFTGGDVKTNVGRITFGLPITKKFKVDVGGSHVSNPYYNRTGVDTVRANYTTDNGTKYSVDANFPPGNLGGMFYVRKPI